MTIYDQDDMRRPHGARHPLAGLSQALLDAALDGARSVGNIIGSTDDEDYRAGIESILIALRAGGHLSNAPLFAASMDEYVVDENGEPCGKSTGKVLDLHDWPHSEDITETLFGETSIPWDKAVWAVEQLNTDYVVSDEAWARHQEKIKESAS